MTPITWEWFALRAMWSLFGAFVMFVLLVVIAPVILSGRISRWEEQQPLWDITYAEPEPEPEPATPERDAELAEAEAEFYYRMATGQN